VPEGAIVPVQALEPQQEEAFCEFQVIIELPG